MRRSSTLLSLFTLLFFSTLYGVSNLRAQNSSQQVEASATQQDTTLEREVQVIREYDARMQETVYWALGVVVVVLILLGGFSWYTNFRVYERDLANLRAEVKVSVDQAAISLKEEVVKLVSDGTKGVSEAQSKFASQIRTEINKVQEGLGKRPTKGDLFWLRLNFLGLKIEFMEASKSTSYSILRGYVELLEVAVNLDYEYKIASTLDVILRMMKNGAGLYEKEIAQLLWSLDRLPRHLVPKGESVRALIADATRG